MLLLGNNQIQGGKSNSSLHQPTSYYPVIDYFIKVYYFLFGKLLAHFNIIKVYNYRVQSLILVLCTLTAVTYNV